MQQDSDFACHSDCGSLLGRLAAAGGEMQAVATEVAVGTKWTEESLRPLHEQTT